MPIRFHCQSCRVALSIASRKSGETVTCPKCRTSLRVPMVAQVPALSLNVGHHNRFSSIEDRPLFENDDLAEIYGNGPDVVELTDSETSDEPELIHQWDDRPMASQPGVHLSSGALVMIGVLQLLLLAMTFALGYFCGAWF